MTCRFCAGRPPLCPRCELVVEPLFSAPFLLFWLSAGLLVGAILVTLRG